MFFESNVRAGRRDVSIRPSLHHGNVRDKLITRHPLRMKAYKKGTVKERVGREADSEGGRNRKGVRRGLAACGYNPRRIKLQGVMLDFYVNNVHQHMTSELVVDATFI